MNYEGNIIRPPSEADSIILQVTVGCSHNGCTFCGAYRDKLFRIKDSGIIDKDIDFAAQYCGRQKTVFLADGNALVLPQARLVELLKKIKNKLPQVRRVSLYANARDILRRSPLELKELKEMGVRRIYMGLESGHDPTLAAIAKGDDSRTIIAAGSAVREAGIFLSVTVLLGIAGIAHSLAHAEATAFALNAMRPNQVAVLTLMLLDNTPLAGLARAGRFHLPERRELFVELRTLLEHLHLPRAQFQANHASNYFSLDGRLPKDKDSFLSFINDALSGKLSLKPEHCRAL
jgi:radical SAM superfamily enzyme YgiQ (UPF0313 family)